MDISTKPDNLTTLRHLYDQLAKWRPEIEKALKSGQNTHTFDDVIAMIHVHRLMAFFKEDSFVMFEKIDFPRFAVFHCFLAGGELESVLSFVPDMKKIAQHIGCSYLSMAGRKGWEPVLKKGGWDFVCTTMYLPIKEDEDG